MNTSNFVKEKPSALVKNSSEVNVSIFEEWGKQSLCETFSYPHFWVVLKNTFAIRKGLSHGLLEMV